jgi:hypothetical protein
MTTEIKLDISTPIAGACRSMTHLIESGYLPQSIKTDIEILMRGAMAWEMTSGIYASKPETVKP